MDKKSLLVIGSGVVIVIAAVTGILLTREDSSPQPESMVSTTQENKSTPQQNNGKTFSPALTGDASYEATITGSDEDGQPYSGTFKNNGAGIAQFSTEIDGESADFYYADNSYIFCQGADCFKVPAESGEVPFDLDTFEFSSSDVETYKGTATFIESASCPAGTCDVWSYTDGPASGKLYLDSENRVSQLVTADENGAEVKIVYDYRAVDVVLPENIQELPGNL